MQSWSRLCDSRGCGTRVPDPRLIAEPWRRARRSGLTSARAPRELALRQDQRGVVGGRDRPGARDDRNVLADRQGHLHRPTSRAAGSASVLRSVPSSRRRQAAYRGGPPSRQVGLRPRPACAQSSCRPGYQYEVVTVTSPVMRAQHA